MPVTTAGKATRGYMPRALAGSTTAIPVTATIKGGFGSTTSS